MPKKEIINNNNLKIFLKGILDAINVPGFALCSTMVGFSVIAKEAGFNIWMVIATTASVWGLPGQVALAGLYAVGSSLFLIFVAVSLANMRMMLMVVSGADILRLHSFKMPLWKRTLLMHFMAITSWAQIGFVQKKYPHPLLLNYYIGFSLTIFFFGILGTIIGFYLNEIISPDILRIIIFVTPLYILLLVINAKQTANRLSVVIGGTICPLIYPITNNWSILVSGIIGGSAAIIILHLKKKF